MKKIVALAFCLALPACVAPPAITVASLALSGVSFMQTGKTIPDHALSSVSQRDCKMFRATRGEQICQTDPTLGLDEPIAVAFAPTDATVMPWPEDITALPAPLDPPAKPPAGPIEPVVVASLAPIPVPVPAAVAPFSAPTVAQAPDAPPIAAPVNEALKTAPLPARGESAALAEPVTATKVHDTQTEAPAAAPAESSRHLVIGSFRNRARATAHVERLGDDDLRVLTSQVKGRTQYRVVAGPFPASDLAAAKQAFVARGIKGAWPIKLRETPSGFQVAAR